MSVRPLLFSSLFCVALCTGMTGCASILSSGNETLKLTSVQPKVHVDVLDSEKKVVASGDTPCKVVIVRGAGYFRPADYTLRATAAGFPTKEVPLRAGLNGWYFGNLIIGGAIGMVVVDPLTGAMFSFPDTEIDMTSGVPHADRREGPRQNNG